MGQFEKREAPPAKRGSYKKESRMMMHTAVNALAALTALIAAAVWFWSAWIKPSYPLAYLDGPPPQIVDRINRQARLNGIAAAFTGASALLQCIALVISN